MIKALLLLLSLAMATTAGLGTEPRTGTVGGFFDVVDEEPYFVYGEDGRHYGYEDDFWDGCSVWCAVTDYAVWAEASSCLSESRAAGNLIEPDRGSAWVEGAEGNGVGEYVDVTRRYTVCDEAYGVDFRGFCVVNGVADTAEAWAEYNRVEKLNVYMNGGFVGTFLLKDTMLPQYFDLTDCALHADSAAETVFRFEIASVYPGGTGGDTALTGIEMEFWTPNH